VKIMITGDTHGDFSRFERGGYPELDSLTKEDYVVICGDFGGGWSGDIDEQKKLLALDSCPFTTLFLSGNHENYDLLAKFPIEEWNGGKVQFIRPSVIHLLRGQVYTLGGRTFFTMGGASSHDISDGILEMDNPLFERTFRQLYLRRAMFRVNHLSWWKEELPSGEEYREARENLARCGWKVDYILTHCAPTSIQEALSDGCYHPDALTDFLEEVRQKCRFENWFFGHYHDNCVVEKKYVLLYEQMIALR